MLNEGNQLYKLNNENLNINLNRWLKENETFQVSLTSTNKSMPYQRFFFFCAQFVAWFAA